MRMIQQFTRQVGTGASGPASAMLATGVFAPFLGNDGPTGSSPSGAPATQDNLLTQRNMSNQGWPAHRVAVSYKGPASAPQLPAQFWVYDRLTNAWYEVGAPQNLVANRITYFDVPCLVDHPPMQNNLEQPPTQGQIEGQLVVQPVAGAPTGSYQFALGADLTTLPI